MNRYGVIYKIINKVNGKIYIGQTMQKGGFDARYKRNLRKETDNDHLRKSIDKYGIDNFEIIKEFDIAYSKDELNEKEKYWIKIYNSTNEDYGYNKRHGGDGGRHTDETKKKIGEANKGRVKNAEERERISKNRKGKSKGKDHPNYGKELSIEAKQKISKANKGRFSGEKHPNYGKKTPQHIKDIISKKNKGKKLTQDHINKITEANTGRILNEETRRKISDANKGKCGFLSHASIPIICANTMEIFYSSNQAQEVYNIDSSSILKCCKGNRKSSGIHPETKIPMKWMYLNEFMTNRDKVIYTLGREVGRKSNKSLNKKIICLDTFEIYHGIREAGRLLNLNSSGIAQCCNGNRKSCGGFRWMYYVNYLENEKSKLK